MALQTKKREFKNDLFIKIFVQESTNPHVHKKVFRGPNNMRVEGGMVINTIYNYEPTLYTCSFITLLAFSVCHKGLYYEYLKYGWLNSIQ